MLEGVLLSAAFIASYVGVRAYYGTERSYLGGLWQLDYNLHYLLDRPDKALALIYEPAAARFAAVTRRAQAP